MSVGKFLLDDFESFIRSYLSGLGASSIDNYITIEA